MIVCIILSSLALLAAVANIILLCVRKKRDEARWTAMLQYIDNVCNGTLTAAEETIEEAFGEAKAERGKEREDYLRFMSVTDARFAEIVAEVEKLKAGTVPDYEAAKAAANAVNDFNAGLSAIMNFDPIAVARARRVGGDKEAS